MTDTLHQEPERDQFKSESPIRAFTNWSLQGDYAIGKGFRPSLAHLPSYLDAMERKEGWRIIQILEAGSQTPSFLFRCIRQLSVDEIIGNLQGSESWKEAMREFLEPEERYTPNKAGAKEAGAKIDQALALSAAMDHGGWE